VLIESTAILDYLDELAGPSRALIPDCGHVRREVLHVCALATGLADKAVSLLYERVLRGEESERWVARCRAQIAGVLSVLETGRAQIKTRYWFGDQLTHDDIAVACVVRFTREAHAGLFEAARYPALDRHAETCEALPPFQEIVQPLAPPS
jgi:glutathione S-transferase